MDFLGRKVRIFLAEGSGTLDGFVNSVDRDMGKLTLEKVVDVESGKKMLGLQHLFAEDIEKIDVLEAVTKNSTVKVKEPEPGRQRGQGILRSKYVPEHLSRLKELDPSSLVLRNQQAPNDGLNSSGDSASDSDGYADYNGVTIIGKLNKLFHEAIDYITKHQMIAVSVEGVSIGRNGKLCWILVATPDHVFMFDILRLGKDCFDNGLQDILQNGDILKILHDCRLVADMLYHQYGIEMINVFDTQVANVFVFRLGHHNDWPRYVDGLAPCLVQHLDLSPEQVNWAVVRERFREADEEVWAERPPKKYVIEAGIKNVIYLLELRAVLNEKMMEEFVAGVNIYMTHVKDASKTDAAKYQSNSHLLPQSFQYIRKFMAVYSGHNPNFPRMTYTTDKNGFRENCAGIAQPNVVFSHDSLWHATSAGGDKSGRSRGRRRYVDYFLSESKPPTSSTSAEPRPTGQPGQFDDISSTKHEKQAPVMDPEMDPVCETNLTSNENIPRPTTTDVSHTVSHSDSELMNAVSKQDQSAIHSDASELTGTSLMRALVRDQTPTGITSDSLVFKPAGVQVSHNVNKQTSQERRATVPGRDTRPPRAPSQFRGQRPSDSANVHNSGMESRNNDNAERQVGIYNVHSSGTESRNNDVAERQKDRYNVQNSGKENRNETNSQRPDDRYSTKYHSFSKFGMISQQEIDFARLNYPLASKIDSPKTTRGSDSNRVHSADQNYSRDVEKKCTRDQGRNCDDKEIEDWGDDPVDRDFCFADDHTAQKFKNVSQKEVGNPTDSGKYSHQASDYNEYTSNATRDNRQSQGLVFQSSLTAQQQPDRAPTELLPKTANVASPKATTEPSPKAKRLQDMMLAIQSQKGAMFK